MSATPLAQILFSRLFSEWPQPEGAPREGRAAFEADVERELSAIVSVGESAWPELRVETAEFVAYVTDRLDPSGPVLDSLRGVRARDIYLACACSTGDLRAIAAFERSYMSGIDAALDRMGVSEDVRDDAKQVLRRRFFVAEDGRLPRIGDYSGRGDLRRWVRASAVRAAFRIMRKSKAPLAVDDSVLEALAAPGQDLELNFLKQTYGKAFEQALRLAFGELVPRDRNLLRYYFGKGLTIDALSVLYRVHRATAARRVQKANAELVARTRDALARHLGIRHADVSSILRLIRSQIERTLSGLMAAREPRT